MRWTPAASRRGSFAAAGNWHRRLRCARSRRRRRQGRSRVASTLATRFAAACACAARGSPRHLPATPPCCCPGSPVAWGKEMPPSMRKPRIWLITAVWRCTSRSRTRWRACRSSCASGLDGNQPHVLPTLENNWAGLVPNARLPEAGRRHFPWLTSSSFQKASPATSSPIGRYAVASHPWLAKIFAWTLRTFTSFVVKQALRL